MSREWSVAPFQSGLEHTSVTEAVQYSAAFPWGDWHVTTAAYNAFGFEPINPDMANVQDGFVANTEEAPRTRIFLTTPGELGTAAEDGPAGSFFINKPTIHKQGVEVIVSVLGTREAASERNVATLEALVEEGGGDSEDYKRDFLLAAEASLEEVIRESVTEVTIGSMSQVLGNVLIGAHLQRERAEWNRHLYQIVRGGGLIALGGIVAYTGIDIALHNPYAGLGTVVGTGPVLAKYYRQIRDHLEQSAPIEWQRQNEVRERVGKIAADIRLLYDRDYFNQRMTGGGETDSAAPPDAPRG